MGKVCSMVKRGKRRAKSCSLPGSNWRPSDYETDALPTEPKERQDTHNTTQKSQTRPQTTHHHQQNTQYTIQSLLPCSRPYHTFNYQHSSTLPCLPRSSHIKPSQPRRSSHRFLYRRPTNRTISWSRMGQRFARHHSHGKRSARRYSELRSDTSKQRCHPSR